MNLKANAFEAAGPVYRQIEARLRRSIEDGSLPAGARLPSARELAFQWKASYLTVHKALSCLAKEGLLDRCSQRGTFVKGSCRRFAGIICGPDLDAEPAHFYRRLSRLLQEELEKGDGVHGVSWSARVYSGIASRHEAGRALSLFKEDCRRQAFSGLVFIDVDVDGLGLEVKEAKLPCVKLVRSGTDVSFDSRSFALESAEFLAKKGCRRIAFISKSVSTHEEEFSWGLREASGKLGLPAPERLEIPYEWPCEGAEFERAAYESALEWIARWRKSGKAPDGLIVDDDIAMRGIALALVKEGVLMEVVTFANEGVSLHYGMPVHRYEMPVSRLASSAVDLLWRRVRGEPCSGKELLLRGEIDKASVNGVWNNERIEAARS